MKFCFDVTSLLRLSPPLLLCPHSRYEAKPTTSLSLPQRTTCNHRWLEEKNPSQVCLDIWLLVNSDADKLTSKNRHHRQGGGY